MQRVVQRPKDRAAGTDRQGAMVACSGGIRMNLEKEYIATVYFGSVKFTVFCNTLEDAQKSAEESAVDLAYCMGFGANVYKVEVEEV